MTLSVFVDLITTASPVGSEKISQRASVWGPAHRVAVGHKRFEALRNPKYATHTAAFSRPDGSVKSKYLHALTRSPGKRGGAGEGTCGESFSAPLATDRACGE